MANPNFQRDIFISYSSLDRPWAAKLNQSLQAKGIKTFFDDRDLEAGKPWDRQLAMALREARHLVVLWSENAKGSDWVSLEIATFNTYLLSAPPDQSEQRRLISLTLEGQNKALTGLQAITELKDADAYRAGVENVNKDLWQKIVNEIAVGVKKDDPAIPITLAVLAVTADEIDKLQEDLPDLPSLSQLLTKIGIADRNELRQFYGPRRLDWKPFRGSESIENILNRQCDAINQRLADVAARQKQTPRQFRLEPLDPAFWTDRNIVNQERAKLLATDTPSVLVIDPLSLYHNLVSKRLRDLDECFKNEKVVVMMLAPFKTPELLDEMCRTLQSFSLEFINEYYDPPIFPSGSYSNLGLNLSDDQNIKRLFCLNLGQFVSRLQAQQPQARSPFLQQ
ncbi:MAG: toll/interleukin-1 receptor domain-containing protein [Acidobacteria bacterium]|nr:toll/interleukin-1 receptor domain-containing protein [Acidobacteriota bacterium]MBI3426722.1 toll/interleukin-1 receptor domain-containing protein [Acidobacteriota bacterium]